MYFLSVPLIFFGVISFYHLCVPECLICPFSFGIRSIFNLWLLCHFQDLKLHCLLLLSQTTEKQLNVIATKHKIKIRHTHKKINSPGGKEIMSICKNIRKKVSPSPKAMAMIEDKCWKREELDSSYSHINPRSSLPQPFFVSNQPLPSALLDSLPTGQSQDPPASELMSSSSRQT